MNTQSHQQSYQHIHVGQVYKYKGRDNIITRAGRDGEAFLKIVAIVHNSNDIIDIVVDVIKATANWKKYENYKNLIWSHHSTQCPGDLIIANYEFTIITDMYDELEKILNA